MNTIDSASRNNRIRVIRMRFSETGKYELKLGTAELGLLIIRQRDG